MAQAERCERCQGLGTEQPPSGPSCDLCGGTGYYVKKPYMEWDPTLMRDELDDRERIHAVPDVDQWAQQEAIQEARREQRAADEAVARAKLRHAVTASQEPGYQTHTMIGEAATVRSSADEYLGWYFMFRGYVVGTVLPDFLDEETEDAPVPFKLGRFFVIKL